MLMSQVAEPMMLTSVMSAYHRNGSEEWRSLSPRGLWLIQCAIKLDGQLATRGKALIGNAIDRIPWKEQGLVQGRDL